MCYHDWFFLPISLLLFTFGVPESRRQPFDTVSAVSFCAFALISTNILQNDVLTVNFRFPNLDQASDSMRQWIILKRHWEKRKSIEEWMINYFSAATPFMIFRRRKSSKINLWNFPLRCLWHFEMQSRKLLFRMRQRILSSLSQKTSPTQLCDVIVFTWVLLHQP